MLHTIPKTQSTTYLQMYQEKLKKQKKAMQETPPPSPFLILHDYYQKEIGNALATLSPQQFNKAVQTIAALKGKSGHVWTAGNGGSAAIADHAAHNLTWDCTRDFPKEQRISAVSLSTQSNEITARANDTHSDLIFATMLEDQARAGDVFLAFTGSGESKNILNAIIMAKKMGMKTIVVYRLAFNPEINRYWRMFRKALCTSWYAHCM
jgi:phosphoheptose isomerase